MTQICPNCKEKYPDTDNYCGKCGAKLPNAWKGLPDYKSGPNVLEGDLAKYEEPILRILENPVFQTRLLKRIISRATKGFNSDSECEKYLCSEIIDLCGLELIEYLKEQKL